jgi:steroid 5-alpha reductase family enzyme
MIVTVLIENAPIVAACFSVLWFVARRLRDVSLIDAVIALEQHENQTRADVTAARLCRDRRRPRTSQNKG